MKKIVKRAGLKPWPKLFQNLRATRATEIAAEYPAHVEAEWLGHDPKTAKEHYLRVTNADFAKAAGMAQESAGLGAGQDAQVSAQGQASAVSGTVRQIIEKALCDKGLAAEWSVISQLLENDQSSPGRTRNNVKIPGKTQDGAARGSKMGSARCNGG